MASYNYDESGSMALFFIITFLFMILVPLTLSLRPSSSSKSEPTTACQCGPCVQQRAKILRRENGSWWRPSITKKGAFVTVGWIVFAALSYKVAHIKVDNKVYDPFEILGISSSSSVKEIKSHYKKLSKKFHPDKVRLAVNQTADEVSAYFVDLTKAYKSLTDETIRKNFEEYGHPDGRQEVSMGIALPRWIVEAQNNVWVLGVYGLVFGCALPALVGRWWFGSQDKTKDGIIAQTAAIFFKTLTEFSDINEVVDALGRASEWERIPEKGAQDELKSLENTIATKLGDRWTQLHSLATDGQERRLRALILLHAYLLRLPIHDSGLQKAQRQVLMRTPALLNALLNISMARAWFLPMVATMRLHAYLAQAVLPGSRQAKFEQLPGISESTVAELGPDATDIAEVARLLDIKGDKSSDDVKKAADRWGRLELVDASFRVIDERIVTPSALVYLVVKVRLSPPTIVEELTNGEAKEAPAATSTTFTKQDDEFLVANEEAEAPQPDTERLGWAHAPYWPGRRRPGWWIVLADMKTNKVVVPPMRITDVPFSDPSLARNFRSYKLKFQVPPSVGLFTWRVFVISDTFIDEDASRAIQLKIEDVTALSQDEQGAEDDISEPEEDSLAGQMAVMRGGSVKKRVEEESDDESSTDDDEDVKAADSSSDSD
ncbi:Sec63 Brl domain-containing protein [Amylostereum chailletii]|nr:Sec63 Brl domain-containing protein [Amylostereum chailletii]